MLVVYYCPVSVYSGMTGKGKILDSLGKSLHVIFVYRKQNILDIWHCVYLRRE